MWNRKSMRIESTLLLRILDIAASWRKQLGARLPPLGSRVCISVPPCGFRGGRNGVWVGFSRGFSRFPLPQISFHHFSILISSISFFVIRPCDGASGVVGRHPCYSRTINIGASSHLIPRPDLLLDTSWGYFITRKTWKGMNQTKMEGETERHLPKTDDWCRWVRRWAS